jgi:hypothetical protein
MPNVKKLNLKPKSKQPKMKNTILPFSKLQIMIFPNNHFFYQGLAKKTLQIIIKKRILTSKLKRNEIIYLLKKCPNFKYEIIIL